MSETIPSESSKDPLWVVAHLYMDDMLDKHLDPVDDMPRVITRLQYLLNMELRRRAHQDADARWHEDTNNALEAMRAGAVVR
ncbi:MAG: hypothetical protein A4E31_00117 [Methanomassiliicoccales archaeon PtaU1.Bin030]|nr:MAG: hypothetical protein A4E31_00839 [Methanomassiliicoccales archaeon PtaU1.Bin030]OPY31536.1 MAG: hypothetical protein A4E31_00117 [Methanomassiliicoccales archaeon PtaU1.Bin030]